MGVVPPARSWEYMRTHLLKERPGVRYYKTKPPTAIALVWCPAMDVLRR